MAYYVSGQAHLMEDIWKTLVSSKRFLHPLHALFPYKTTIDIDFMVDEVLKKQFPLNITAWKRAKTTLFIPVTRYRDGKGTYFTQRDDIDPYELLRAACAVPYFFGKRVILKDEEYVDGTVSEIFGLRKAKELDPQNLVVILTRPHKKLMKMRSFRKSLEWLWIRKENLVIQKLIWMIPKRYNKDQAFVHAWKDEKNILIIQPEKSLPLQRMGAGQEHLQETIKQGHDDTMNHPFLSSFLKKL